MTSVRWSVAATGADEILSVGTTDWRVMALDADTGSVVEATNLGAVTPTSLTVAGDTVYVGTWDGEVHAVAVP